RSSVNPSRPGTPACGKALPAAKGHSAGGEDGRRKVFWHRHCSPPLSPQAVLLLFWERRLILPREEENMTPSFQNCIPKGCQLQAGKFLGISRWSLKEGTASGGRGPMP
ncbi:UNVERIFIED_CONTAM: hypothetical protein K2H54_067032, partial [Gekko kuhli]